MANVDLSVYKPAREVTFTKDQQNAIDGLIKFINSSWDANNFIVALTGPAGTGKTFSLNYVIKNCKYTGSVINCCTPTHKACRILSNALDGKKVDTIQSTFGFRLYVNIDNFDPNNPMFKPIGNTKLGQCRLLIVDEASMLNKELVKYIMNYCKKAEIKVLFTGDSSQLAPVNESQSLAFKLASQVFVLKEIVRQDAINPITNLLEILRKDIVNRSYSFIDYITKHPNEYDSTNSGYEVCDINEFAERIKYNFQELDYTKDINLNKIVCYKNDRVNQWNNFVRQVVVGDYKTILNKDDLIMSYTSIVNEFSELIFNNSEEYIIHDIIPSTDNQYGFDGYLVRFQAIYGGDITPSMFVVNLRDKFTMEKYYNIITGLVENAKNGTDRVSGWKAYYSFKRKYLTINVIKDRLGKVLFDKDIDYGFALTSHKSQGSTYNHVYVDLKDMIYTNKGTIFTNTDDVLRRIYVACSRASKNLTILWK